MKFIRDFFERRQMRGSRGTVRRLFFDRSEKFIADTAKILKRMPKALEAITELIEERESFKKGGVLEWGEVSLLAADTDDALILLVGIVRFPPGAEVTLQTGEKVNVTADTAQYFPPRIVRIGLPLTMAEASKDEIKVYLKKAQEEQKTDLEEMKKTLKEALGSELEDGAVNIPVVDLSKKKEPVASATDFDLTQLTEEQRRQLQLLTQKTGRG